MWSLINGSNIIIIPQLHHMSLQMEDLTTCPVLFLNGAEFGTLTYCHYIHLSPCQCFQLFPPLEIIPRDPNNLFFPQAQNPPRKYLCFTWEPRLYQKPFSLIFLFAKQLCLLFCVHLPYFHWRHFFIFVRYKPITHYFSIFQVHTELHISGQEACSVGKMSSGSFI